MHCSRVFTYQRYPCVAFSLVTTFAGLHKEASLIRIWGKRSLIRNNFFSGPAGSSSDFHRVQNRDKEEIALLSRSQLPLLTEFRLPRNSAPRCALSPLMPRTFAKSSLLGLANVLSETRKGPGTRPSMAMPFLGRAVQIYSAYRYRDVSNTSPAESGSTEPPDWNQDRKINDWHALLIAYSLATSHTATDERAKVFPTSFCSGAVYFGSGGEVPAKPLRVVIGMLST